MKIYDGRVSFYQWDLNQKITSPNMAVGDEVHFSNSNQTDALVVKAYALEDGTVVADVPNILLMVAQPIFAYRYIKNGDSEHTKESCVFEVKSRPKPSDYVFTKTEIHSIESVVKSALEECKKNGEFVGEKGDKGDKGDPYVLTEADKKEISKAVIQPSWNSTYDASKPVYGLKFAECDIKDSNDEYCCHPDKNIIYRHSLHSPFTFDCNVRGFYSRKHIINPIIADFTLQSDGQIYSQWGANPLTITGLLINTFDNNSISVSQGAFVINNGDEYGIPTVVEWLQ